MGQSGLIAEPLVIAGSVTLRSLHNGIAIFNADRIVEPLQGLGTAPEVTELSGVVCRYGIENHMIVNVISVNMCAYDKGVLALGKTHGKLPTEPVCLFRGNLPGYKALP